MDPILVPVGGTVGILGGGQLGRMMAIAARAMGVHTVVWDPLPNGPASDAADAAISAPYANDEAMEAFIRQVDAVTYEFENVDHRAVLRLAERRPVFPSPELLRVSQHRLREKDRAREYGLATTAYRALYRRADVAKALEEVGLPGILKTVRGGYDGKGQARVRTVEEGLAAFDRLHRHDPLIYEREVPFQAEVSAVVARDQRGRTVTYPVTENHHANGILDYSVAPARIAEDAAQQVRRQAAALAEGLGLVGVMALEFFVTGGGQVLFNEMAPRPHNSGHWTIEAAWPSQFTQHMRAVCGWPVAEPRLLTPVVMVNLLGDLFLDGMERLPLVLDLPGVQLHWYGKDEMRPGRKVGHLTVVADSLKEALAEARKAKTLLGGEWRDGA